MLTENALGLEQASPEEALAKISELLRTMVAAPGVGAEAEVRDWRKLCALERKVEEESGAMIEYRRANLKVVELAERFEPSAVPLSAVPPSAAKGKRQIDQVLKSVPALRAERKQMADQERREAEDAKLAARQQKSTSKRRRSSTSTSTPSARGEVDSARPACSDCGPTSQSDAGGVPNHPSEPTREQLVRRIRAGHARAGCKGALTSQQAQALLRWAEERLDSGDPYTVVMTGRSLQKLPHLKLMFGVPDQKGMLPIYNFGLAKAGWKRVAPMPELLLERVKDLRANGWVVNSCIVNIYPDGAAYIAFHQDQGFSEGSGKYESESSVVIDRVGAARDLAFRALDDTDIDRIRMQDGDSYTLSGRLNVLVKHGVPACDECGLCVTFSWRLVRNRVSPDGKFAVANGKRVPLDLDYLQQALEKKTLKDMREMCGQYKVDATGNKADLVRRLAELPAEALRQLEVAVLAGGHTPDAPMVTRALRVQGPELAELMLTGDKVVENRSVQIGLGWWVVVVGVDRNWRKAKWAKPFKAVLDDEVPSDERLSRYHGHAVGLIYLSEYRTREECSGYRWAGRDCVCHVVSHAVKFETPIKIKGPRGYSQQRWDIETEEERQAVRAQFPADLTVTCHDLTPIHEPEEQPAPSSHGTQPPTLPAAPPPKIGLLKRARRLALYHRQTAHRRAVPADDPVPEGVGSHAAAIDCAARHVPSVMNERLVCIERVGSAPPRACI